jgi:AMMECR1 domain-containing protein
MPIPCAVLMCHAPSAIPEVGGHRARQCAQTTRAMQDLAARVCAHAPDLLVLLSYRAADALDHWGICAHSPVSGSFEALGAPQVGVTLPGAPDAARRLARIVGDAGLVTREAPAIGLAPSALVPLFFLQRGGWQGATLLVSVPHAAGVGALAMGRAIACAAEQAQQRWAIVVAGVLSQRLHPGAEAGHHPLAREFDRMFRARLEAGDLRGACTINRELRELAGEQISDVLRVAASAIGHRTDGQRCYAYESPFGVGYLEALLYEDGVPREREHPQAREVWPWPAMFDLARMAMSAKLRHSPLRAPTLPQPWNASRGVFVTLRDREGRERGRYGHVTPRHGTLTEEILACATAALTADSRLARPSLQELGEMDIAISILGKPEPVADVSTLDPQRYGVVVSAGRFQGVQLPAAAGITKIEQQLTAAAQQGLLPPGRPWTIERFEVPQQASESQLRAERQAAHDPQRT